MNLSFNFHNCAVINQKFELFSKTNFRKDKRKIYIFKNKYIFPI